MNISFLSGLPRSGGTLLNAILSQNPKIHTTGNSPLCQLMWDAHVSCQMTEPMMNYPGLQNKYVSSIPSILYGGIDGHILDKCATWHLPGNIEVIHRYITKEPKFIMTVRPLEDIVKSFIFVRTMNGWQNPADGLLDEGTDPIMREVSSLRNALENRGPNHHFIKYDDLVDNPSKVISSLYNFMGWEKYEHDYNNIVNKNKERDDLVNLIGLHDIRPVLSKRKIDIALPEELKDKAKYLDLYDRI
jgi:sulfotransferase